MGRLLYVGIQTLAAAVVLLPMLIIENKLFFKNRKRTFYFIVFALYLTSVYAVVGLPSVHYIRLNCQINIIPLIPIADDIENSILNVLLFVPFGIALPFLWERFSSLKQLILFGFGTSLLIELLQILTMRATDINDLITNTGGAILGYLIFKLFNKKPPLISRDKDETPLYIIGATVFLVMFFIQPFIAPILEQFVY